MQQSPTCSQCISMAREVAVANQLHHVRTACAVSDSKLGCHHHPVEQHQPDGASTVQSTLRGPFEHRLAASALPLQAACSNVEVSRGASQMGSVDSLSCLSMCATGTAQCLVTDSQAAHSHQRECLELDGFQQKQEQGQLQDVQACTSSHSKDVSSPERQHVYLNGVDEEQQQQQHAHHHSSCDEHMLEQLGGQLATLQLRHDFLLQEHSSLLDRHALLQQQHASSQELCLELMQQMEQATREKQDAQWQQQEQQQRVTALRRQLEAAQQQQQKQQQEHRLLQQQHQEQQHRQERQAAALKQQAEGASQQEQRRMLEHQCCHAEASTSRTHHNTKLLSQLCTELLQAALQLQTRRPAGPSQLPGTQFQGQRTFAGDTGDYCTSKDGHDGDAANGSVNSCCKALLKAQAARAVHARAMADAAAQLEQAQQLVLELTTPGSASSPDDDASALLGTCMQHAQGGEHVEATSSLAQGQQQQQQQQRMAELEGQLAAAMLEKRQLHARLRLSVMVGHVGKKP